MSTKQVLILLNQTTYLSNQFEDQPESGPCQSGLIELLFEDYSIEAASFVDNPFGGLHVELSRID